MKIREQEIQEAPITKQELNSTEVGKEEQAKYGDLIPTERARDRLLRAWIELWEIVESFEGTPGLVSMLHRFAGCAAQILADLIGERGIATLLLALPGKKGPRPPLRKGITELLRANYTGLESFPISLKMAAKHNLLNDLLTELGNRSIHPAKKRTKKTKERKRKVAAMVSHELRHILYQTSNLSHT